MAKDVGYPLVVRPSYVLGGRAMEIVYSEEELTFMMAAKGNSSINTREYWLNEGNLEIKYSNSTIMNQFYD